MTDTFKPISDDPGRVGDPEPSSSSSKDTGRALLVGVLGGVVSAAGYLVYARLPDEQKDRLHQQVRQLVEGRVNELRSRLNI